MGSLFWVLNVITSVIEKGASGTLDYRREEVVMMETEIGVMHIEDGSRVHTPRNTIGH